MIGEASPDENQLAAHGSLLLWEVWWVLGNLASGLQMVVDGGLPEVADKGKSWKFHLSTWTVQYVRSMGAVRTRKYRSVKHSVIYSPTRGWCDSQRVSTAVAVLCRILSPTMTCNI